MMTARDRALLLVLGVLGVVLIVALGGVIWLASALPARSIPDVLVALPPMIISFYGGVLVTRPGDEP